MVDAFLFVFGFNRILPCACMSCCVDVCMCAYDYHYHEGLHVACLLITEPLLTGIPILRLQDAHPEAGQDQELHPQGGSTCSF